MADSKEKALHKHVRIAPEQWERLERAAQGTPHSPNQILVELAMEALDRRDWPSTEVEMRVARASLFTAQAIALDLIAAGRDKEVQDARALLNEIAALRGTAGQSATGRSPNPADGQRRAQPGAQCSHTNDSVTSASICRTHSRAFPLPLRISTEDLSETHPSSPSLNKYAAPTIG